MANISTPYLRIPANQFHTVFKAGEEDVVLTVEFKNLNQNRVKFSAELYNQNEQLLGIPFAVDVPENKSYKRYNVLVKAGTVLNVKTTQPGFAVRAYAPALYSKPGQLNVGNGQTVKTQVFLDADGVHNVQVKGVPQGITITPLGAQIQEGYPVEFTITRDDVSRVVGPIFFAINALNIGTAIDVMTEAPQPDDGSGDGNPNDPDIDVDMVAAYISGRDSVH